AFDSQSPGPRGRTDVHGSKAPGGDHTQGCSRPAASSDSGPWESSEAGNGRCETASERRSLCAAEREQDGANPRGGNRIGHRYRSSHIQDCKSLEKWPKTTNSYRGKCQTAEQLSSLALVPGWRLSTYRLVSHISTTTC